MKDSIVCVAIVALVTLSGCGSGESEVDTQRKIELTKIGMPTVINVVRTERLIRLAGFEQIPDNWPTSLDQLDTEDLAEDSRIDAWGNKLRITVGATETELRSAGPNGTFGDSDDIVLTEPRFTPEADEEDEQDPSDAAGGESDPVPEGSSNDEADVAEIRQLLLEMDQNKDGFLSREEATGPRIKKHFDRIDRNKDDRLGRNEIKGLLIFLRNKSQED